MAVISKGITLSYKTSESGEFTNLTNLQEIPELGGDTEAIEALQKAAAADYLQNLDLSAQVENVE